MIWFKTRAFFYFWKWLIQVSILPIFLFLIYLFILLVVPNQFGIVIINVLNHAASLWIEFFGLSSTSFKFMPSRNGFHQPYSACLKIRILTCKLLKPIFWFSSFECWPQMQNLYSSQLLLQWKNIKIMSWKVIHIC